MRARKRHRAVLARCGRNAGHRGARRHRAGGRHASRLSREDLLLGRSAAPPGGSARSQPGGLGHSVGAGRPSDARRGGRAASRPAGTAAGLRLRRFLVADRCPPGRAGPPRRLRHRPRPGRELPPQPGRSRQLPGPPPGRRRARDHPLRRGALLLPPPRAAGALGTAGDGSAAGGGRLRRQGGVRGLSSPPFPASACIRCAGRYGRCSPGSNRSPPNCGSGSCANSPERGGHAVSPAARPPVSEASIRSSWPVASQATRIRRRSAGALDRAESAH